MRKTDQILLFLGRIQARIEDIGAWAVVTNNPISYLIADIEEYFNMTVNQIFYDGEKGLNEWPKGITWNTLPK